MIIILLTMYLSFQNYTHLSLENKIDSLANNLLYKRLAQTSEFVLITDKSFDFNTFSNQMESLIDTMYYTHGKLLVVRHSNTNNDSLIFRLIHEHVGVTSISANRSHRASYVPSDIHANSWNLRNLGQSPASGIIGSDVNMIKAWDITTGSSSIHIAILDSGIPMNSVGSQLNHPDLGNSNRIILGSSPIPDFVDESRSLRDVNGHGTLVSGIVGAEGNNDIGLAGICFNCKIVPIQVFNYLGWGDTKSFYDGVIYSVEYLQSIAQNSRVIINFSGEFHADSNSVALPNNDLILESAIQYASTYEVPIIVAAGNEVGSHTYKPVASPASFANLYDNVIAVSATNHKDEFSSFFSRSGPEITLAAPGGNLFTQSGPNNNKYTQYTQPGNIWSTAPTYEYTMQTYTEYDTNGNPIIKRSDMANDYAFILGTSFAAPHVSGAVGLMLSVNPSLTPAQIKTILTQSAKKVPEMGDSTFTQQHGYGRLDVFEALRLALPNQMDSPYISGNQTLGNAHIHSTSQPETIHEWGTLTIPADKTVLVSGVYMGFGTTDAKIQIHGRMTVDEGSNISGVDITVKSGGR